MLVLKLQLFSNKATLSANRLTFALIIVYIVCDLPVVCSVILGKIASTKLCYAIIDCDIDAVIATRSSIYAASLLSVSYAFRFTFDPIIAFIVDRRLRNCLYKILRCSVIKCSTKQASK